MKPYSIMDWSRGHTIGRGSTAAVYKAESRHTGKVFAVKSAELHWSDFLKREKDILSTLNCPQIVSYQGFDVTFENGAHYYNLFMEYAPRGTIADVVRHDKVVEEAPVRSYTRQILQGLKYLHANGIVHCDVKGQNVLVTDQGAKLADFGCAKRVSEVAAPVAGTPAFMAPEVARGEQQGFPADVWALGCTVLEMITGKQPWQGVSEPAVVLYRVGYSGEVPVIPDYVCEEGKDFLSKCFKSDPFERWIVSELLNHDFVRELNLVCNEFAFACDLKTPTSVLEKGSLWDTKTNQDVTHGSSSWNFSSPRDRINMLRTAQPFRQWDDDDDQVEWVIVRSVTTRFSVENRVYDLRRGETSSSDKEVLEVMSLGSIDKMEDYGPDTVCNCMLKEYIGLVSFYEPKIMVANVIEFNRWNGFIDECYLRSFSRELLLCCTCVVLFPLWKYDDCFKKHFFIMQLFLLYLSLFSSTLQFIIIGQCD